MGRFIFDLPDELREKLELHRIAWGLRSLSAAVQHLIATKAETPMAPSEVGRIMREIGERPETKALTMPRAVPGSRLKKPKGTK